MMGSNVTHGAAVAGSSHALEDKVMAVLPLTLRRWLQEEAATDYDPVQLFKLMRQGHTAESLLRALRTQQRRETAELYGRAHPQAAFSTALA